MRRAVISTRESMLGRSASHLGVWAGLYVTGAVLCFGQLAAITAGPLPGLHAIAAAFAFCTATAVYLLDRVKLRDAWLDPADAQAHPARYAFISRHRRALRIAMACLIVAASWLGERMIRGGAFVPIIAAAGVLLYAGRPRHLRSRPKDVLILKNIYVAFGIAGYAAIVALAGANPGAGWKAIAQTAAAHPMQCALAFFLLAGRVFADAVLCDLDDERSDRQFGTSTLPTQLGRERAWSAAFRLRLLVAAALIIATPLPLWPRLTWAAVTTLSSLTLRLASPQRVRDWVDIRLPLEAIAVAFISLFLGNC